ncbi:SusC/RagA family TonB-linked outer membrane protein [Bacteroides sp. 224]|uniref:SusC/RagA family TonB-linked outer membrane protein n=1 Tax=Bacteroides sp. 224 TaxID=2302936 RepID=UPI0013D060A1|nr:SusC/RagA family TonB-linked outer membrane protein [Bacteroides sp. 224]NDV65341.1 SusC/RagA family TonB-linked outer membrane protein [Bacteroides sp. 224]
MKNIKTIMMALLLLLATTDVCGQEVRKISGKVLSELNKPVEGAIVSVLGGEEVNTGKDGTFQLELKKEATEISIWAVGYYPVTQQLNARSEVVVVLMPKDQYKYNQSAVLPFRVEESRPELTSAVNIAKKDFGLGSMKIDRALSGQVAGLKTTRTGGMPGEGSYMNLRGIQSLVGENAPLIVINGVPYLPDSRESQLINGFTRDIFQAYNINDIQNVTVLKGAEASMYGSMGANGVILIETDGATSDDLNTKISFYGQYGVNWNNKRLPLMNGIDYKSYLSDVGMTYYDNMENFFNNFPFLSNPSSKYYYLYNNNTDWQDQIYKKGFVTDNLFRVEGGDEIAKYDLSLGYAHEDGILENTNSQRYHTQLNTNVLISKNVEMFATIGLAYLNGTYQEQGMIAETNPLLAAYSRAPLLSPYNYDETGNALSVYSSYYYGHNQNMDFAVSNPLAIVNTLDGRSRQYDVNVRAGLTYKLLPELTLTGTVGLYYNYNSEHLFVPGLTDQSILPFFNQYGEANNTVKEGTGKNSTMYYNLNGRYQKVFNGVHRLNALVGVQAVMAKQEYDAGVGRNTANDFYQTLGSTQAVGRYFYGYLEKWNWMNFYGHADYTYNNMIAASVNMAVDGASSAGTYGDHFFVYPSVGLTWLGKGWLPLSNSTLVNRLNVRVEYGLTGNSRFSSNLGKFYYSSLPYQAVSGIVRANLSNTKLKPEQTAKLNLGFDMSLLNNRIDLSFDYYNNQSKDVIFATPHSSAFGTGKLYDNLGKIENQGVELALQASLVRTQDFEWIVGGNIAKNKNKVKSLGGINQLTTKYDDGVQLTTQVGGNPYEFYGYQAVGVFSTQAEADAAKLINQKGQAFKAGDVHYVDQNKDGRIDDKDRVSLGNATPNFFGGFYTQVNYKSFGLSAEFSYSKGNKAYNAVRRSLESLSTFGNQSISAVNRWNLEGQVTDMPRAEWGDPIGNNDFSSRWIEDASYLRMKSITFSYSFDKKVLNFIRSGTLYVTGENLLTATKYLGLDPEFSYSYGDATQGFDYAKLMQPKSVKIGVNLKF